MTGRFAALGLAVLVSACASTPTVTTDFNPAAKFGAYRSYSWMDKPDGGSPLMQQRIVDGIDTRLQARGWKLVPNGDVHVSAHVTAKTQQTYDTYYNGAGYGLGWGGFGPAAPSMSTTTVNTYEIGTLVVDMFDGASKKAVWRGSASGTLQDDPNKMNAMLQAALDKMFAAFPPGTAPAK
jgi:hypothetical protein